jgi:hypothetical protein
MRKEKGKEGRVVKGGEGAPRQTTGRQAGSMDAMHASSRADARKRGTNKPLWQENPARATAPSKYGDGC